MKINKLFVAMFVMLSLVLSVSATGSGGGAGGYDSTLVLENKDPSTWTVVDGGFGGVLSYNSAGPEFEFSFTGTVSQENTDYTLVYYIDVGPTDPETGKPWNLENSVPIATGTSDEGGNLVISGSSDLGSLPQPGDYNANPNQGDSYCNGENGYDYYLHCSGAKIWLITGELSNSNWNPTAWLFETDMMSYFEDDEAPEITNVHNDPAGYLTCDQSNVHVYATITDDSDIDPDSVKVSWRYDGSPIEGYSTPLFLHDSVNNIWRGVIDVNGNGAHDGLVISYHVGAKDVFGNSAWEPKGYTEIYTYDCTKPTANAGGPYTCNEGTIKQLDGSGSSDTVDQELYYAWDLDNDGEFDDPTVENPMFTCGDDSDGEVTVSLTVTDDGGNTDTATTTVIVSNVNPTADAGEHEEGAYFCDEGETILLDAGGSNDPVDEIVLYEWDLDNDQEFDDATGVEVEYVCGDGYAEVPVAVKVTDDDNGWDVDGATIVVISNVAPVVEAGEDVNSNEGEEVTIEPTFTDFNADTHTATVDWGDQSEPTAIDPAVSPLSASHTYGDNGVYIVTVTVNDGEDDGSDTLTVDVSNLDPTITDLGLGSDDSYRGVKHEGVCFDATATDPAGENDPLVYTWDFNGDGEYDDGEGADACNTWDNRFEGTVGLKVEDGDGGEATATVPVTVYDYKIDLGPNRNLISLPLVPEDTAIVEVLNGVTPEAVWAYQYNEETGKNEWLFHPPEAPEGVGSLEKMVPGYGYYVFMDEEGEGDTLYANGNKYYDAGEGLQIPMPPQVTLTTGWNLIGHYGMNVVDKWWEVQDLSGGSLTDLAILTLLDEEAVPATMLVPKTGYWVFVTSQENLFYAPSVADYCDEGPEGCEDQYPYWWYS